MIKAPLKDTMLQFACSGGSAVAAGEPPVFGHPDFPKPENWREVTVGEFAKLDPSRPARIGASRHPWASPEEFLGLGEWFASTAAGRAAWESEAAFAAQTINQWHLSKTGFGANRYTYSLRDLTCLSLAHLFTGHDLLGQFLKKHLAHIAALPPAFWLHSELRGNNAGLETAQTGLAFANALAASPDLFTANEIASMDAALRTKALVPCLDWLKTDKANNWTAVLATGTLVMARYLDDGDAQQTAVRRLRWYLDSTVETDGSYGEGTGYFYYPMDTLFSAALAMSSEQLKTVFSGAPLANSSRWLAYHYFLFRDKNAARYQPVRAHFHDNSYWGGLPAEAACLFASLYNDGLARWLGDAFGNSAENETETEGGGGLSWQSFLFLQKQGAGAKLPPTQTPAELGLPTIASFASGDNFIRSGWGDSGVVFALNNAGATKTNYSHHHACRNSFVLAAFGEYLVVSPGSASYRSPLHLEYDVSTRAQNTVEIDNKNQLLPRLPQTEAMVLGQPVAETTLLAAGKTADVLASDATGAYAQPHKQIGRVVVYAREPGYFVIFDRLESTGENHSYAWRLHFNNRDGRAAFSTTKREGGGESYSYLLKRPKAALELFVAADAPLDASVGEGHMHGQSRDYSPGGVNEGSLGSAIELTVRNREPAANLDIVSVLRPLPVAAADPTRPAPLSISFSQGKLHVGQDMFSLNDNTLVVTIGGVTETFVVW
ncbi:heparinase [Opitutaceae bacterium TAV4]|nr:heparinase [Opitutaceae bacterium TAV4]RRK02265.1 heparinase [Opitutaceae bacterium TAV3]